MFLFQLARNAINSTQTFNYQHYSFKGNNLNSIIDFKSSSRTFIENVDVERIVGQLKNTQYKVSNLVSQAITLTKVNACRWQRMANGSENETRNFDFGIFETEIKNLMMNTV